MSLPLEEIAGEGWARLGLPDEAGEAELAGVLSWSQVVRWLAALAPDDPFEATCRALLCLDALGSAEQAGDQLDGVDPQLPLTQWLIAQLAQHAATVERALSWRDLAAAASRRDTPLLQTQSALLRLVLGADLSPSLTEAKRWPRPGAPFRAVRELLLAAAGRWSELVTSATDAPALSRLVAAHVSGDRLGDSNSRDRALQRLAEQAPLLSCEGRLELALAGEDRDAALELLRRRHEALLGAGEAHRPLAEATALALQLQLPQTDPSLPALAEALSDEQAAAAWRAARALAARLTAVSEGRDLVPHYLEEAAQSSGEAALVLRLRAAELLLARDEPAAALQALDHNAPSGLVGALWHRYRLLCHGLLGQWAALGLELSWLARDVSYLEERCLLWQLACELAGRGGAQGAGAAGYRDGAAVLEAVHSGLEDLDGVLALRLSGSLLVAHRRQNALRSAGQLWTGLSAGAGETEQGALFAFGLGVNQLLRGHGAAAAEALELAGRRLSRVTPALRLAGVLSQMAQGQWEEAVEGLSDLAGDAPRVVSGEMLRAAAQMAAARAENGHQALLLLERSQQDAPHPRTPLELAAVHFRLGRHLEAAEVLAGAEAGCGDVVRRAQLQTAQAVLYQHELGDLVRAESLYREALQSHPLLPPALEGLQRLLYKQERAEEVAPLLADQLAVTTDDKQRLNLLLRLEVLHLELWQTSGDAAQAEACIQRCGEALAISPRCKRAERDLVQVCVKLHRWQQIIDRVAPERAGLPGLRGLRKALQETRRWEALARVCRRLAELSGNPRESLAAAVRAGDVYQEQFGQLDLAEECYRWAVDRYREAVPLSRLAGLLRAQGRHDELAQTLEDLLEVQTDEERQVALLLELGQVRAEHLDAPGPAREALEQVVARRPDNRAALLLLERLLDDDPGLADRARVLEKLLATLRPGSEEELRVLLKLGQLYGELKDDRSLLRMANRLHHRHAHSAEAASFAEEVYTDQARFADLCDLYAHRAQHLEEEPGNETEVAALLERKGTVELRRLEAISEAAVSFSRVVELRPEDEATLEMLEQILAETGDWQRLVDLFERRANSLERTEARKASLRRAAHIAQNELHDEAETARLYERIQELDPADAESFAFLERKLERMDDSKRLVELLLDRAGRVETDQEALEALVRAAGICEKLEEVPRAIRIYKQALERAPSHRPALDALSRIYESLERWSELEQVTEAQVELEQDAEKRAMLLFKLGSVRETQFQDDGGAEKLYARAAATWRGCLPALHGLRDLFTRRGQWQQVVDTLRQEAAVWSDPKGKADVLAQLAEVLARHLDQPEEALRRYKEAIRIYPDSMPAALALFEAYSRRGDVKQAEVWGDVYARRVQARGSRAQRVAFYVRWAAVLRQIERFKDAADFLAQALELRPGQLDALLGLLDLCREAPDYYDYDEAFDVLTRRAEKREDHLALAVLSTARGVLAEHRGDIDAALRLYEIGLEGGGDRIHLARPMADLLVLLGRQQRAEQIVDRCRARADTPEQREAWIEATLWLAEYHTRWQDDHGAALELHQQAVDRAPQRDDLVLALARAAVLAGDSRRATLAYRRLCQRIETRQSEDTAAAEEDPAAGGSSPGSRRGGAGDQGALARHLYALGLAAFRSGDPDQARQSWRHARELDPSIPLPSLGLIRIQAGEGRWEEAQQAIEQLLEQSPRPMPDLLRAAADFHASRGNLVRASALMERAAQAEAYDPLDLVRLAELQLRQQRPGAAAVMLRRAMADEVDLVPAISLLQRIWAAGGERDQARRAGQVLALALGGLHDDEGLPASGGLRALGRDQWRLLVGELDRRPLTQLCALIDGAYRDQRGLDPPLLAPLDRPDLQATRRELEALFGVKLDLACHPAPRPLCLVHGGAVVLGEQATALAPHQLKPLLAQAHAATRLGLPGLLGLRPEQQLDLGRMAALLLSDQGAPGGLAPERLANLPRRELRQIQRLQQQHVLPLEGVAFAVQSWLHSFHRFTHEAALLATDHLLGLAKILAMEAGMPPGCITEGGLLGALPSLRTLAAHFLSPEFHLARQGVVYVP